MKKLFFVLFSVMVGFSFIACSSEMDMKTAVEKAKTEGANWNESQWKEAYKAVLLGAKPMLQDISAIQKKMEGMSEEQGMEAAAAMMKDLGEIMEKYKDIETQMNDFEKAADASEIGKNLGKDEKFQREVFKELGMEDLMDALK